MGSEESRTPKWFTLGYSGSSGAVIGVMGVMGSSASEATAASSASSGFSTMSLPLGESAASVMALRGWSRMRSLNQIDNEYTHVHCSYLRLPFSRCIDRH
jgi:hypothetical protein